MSLRFPHPLADALWTNITVSGGQVVSGNVYVPQQPENFQYDADGNLTNDGRWQYVWDAENRLITMIVNTNVGPQYKLAFAYDPEGRRISKVVSTNGVAISTNIFLYDGWNLVATVSPSDALINSFMWGPDLSGQAGGALNGARGVGGLLEATYYDYGTSTTNCFPAYDGNGNIMALVNAANGQIVANYEYGPFGEVIRSTGPMATANPFRFSTKYQDDESDLLYYGYRFYKASTGTWGNRDLLGEKGGINLYTFAKDQPVNLVDHLGLQSFPGSILPPGFNPVLPFNYQLPPIINYGPPIIVPSRPTSMGDPNAGDPIETPLEPESAPGGSEETDTAAGSLAEGVDILSQLGDEHSKDNALEEGLAQCNKYPHSLSGNCYCCRVSLVGIKNRPEEDDIAYFYGIGIVIKSPCSNDPQPSLVEKGTISKEVPFPW